MTHYSVNLTSDQAKIILNALTVAKHNAKLHGYDSIESQMIEAINTLHTLKVLAGKPLGILNDDKKQALRLRNMNDGR